jgi:hypothetical protein
MTFDIDVNVPLGVDVVDASAPYVIGAGIGPTVVDLCTLPGASTSACRSLSTAAGTSSASATAATAGCTATTTAAATAATTRGVSVGGHREAGQKEGGQRGRKKLAE